MKIVYNPSFENSLIQILEFIYQDKPSASFDFAENLKKTILDIPYNPYSHRKSIYFDETEVIDLIFKGYTIVYEIKKPKTIEILKIFNKNLPT
ncbi:MAG: type II toxin-antitoxin system RelE/ParE family toxin [Campylobacterales bacterium]|nr:type II toxin-antitoxin system RelE/ParE family toxin [Campylobacterales bacterium]